MPSTISINDIKVIIVSVASITDDSIVPLFLGAPGIGKTARVVAAALEIAAEQGKRYFVDLSDDARIYSDAVEKLKILTPRTPRELVKVFSDVQENPDDYYVFLRIVATQMTPEDLQYPRLFGEIAVVNAPPVNLAFLMIPGISGMLFLDEITNVKREEAKTAFFALINEKTVGLSGGLSENVVVVAAGNTDEESSVAEPLPAPLMNRFVKYVVRPPTPQEFTEFYEAWCRGCDPAVTAYLSASRDAPVYVPPEEPETFENFPSPRTWFRLGKLLPRLPSLELKRATAEGLLGPRVGAEFAAWLAVRPPSAQELLEKPETFRKLKFEQQMLSVVVVARHINAVVADSTAGVEKLAEQTARLLNVIYNENAEAALTLLRTALAGVSKDASKRVRQLQFLVKVARTVGLEKLTSVSMMLREIEEQLR